MMKRGSAKAGPLFCFRAADRISCEIKNLQFPKVNIIVHILHIHFDWCIIGNAKQRRSILVGSAGSQVGPKNPMKGISMKSLVSAFYAQFRVDAGG